METAFPGGLRGRELVIVAGGTGVSPVRGVIDYFGSHPEETASLQVITGFKSPRDILFGEDLKRWEDQMELTLTVDAADEGEKRESGAGDKVYPRSCTFPIWLMPPPSWWDRR